jgi:hypothetical protein
MRYFGWGCFLSFVLFILTIVLLIILPGSSFKINPILFLILIALPWILSWFIVKKPNVE